MTCDFPSFPKFLENIVRVKFRRNDNIKQRAFYACLRHGQLKMAASEIPGNK